MEVLSQALARKMEKGRQSVVLCRPFEAVFAGV
jgi:hypothetical protein